MTGEGMLSSPTVTMMLCMLWTKVAFYTGELTGGTVI
jgi:hypothetical protein